MKKLLPILLSVFVATGMAQDAPEVTPVGTLLSFTGPLAEFGPAHQNAATLAADQLNAAAESVLGGPLMELVHEDTGTNPATGVDRARKLVDVDGVPAIMGALSSGVSINVAESVTIPSEVVQISPASTSPLITFLEDGDFMFRTVASDALQGVVAAQLARGELNDVLEGSMQYDTAAVIYVNNPYGQGLAEGFAQAFEERGGTVQAMVAHPEEPQPTYASQLEEALAGDPDVLLAVSYPGQATVYLQEARDLFGMTEWQFVDGTKSEEMITALGEDVVEGQYGTAPGSDPQWGGFQRFVEQFQAEYDRRPPLPFMDAAYDATAVIGLGLALAHAEGLEPTGPNVRDMIRRVADGEGETVGVGEFEEALRLIELGTEIDYSGAASTVDFDEAGEVVTPVEVWQYTGGSIETVDIRTADQVPAE